MKAFRNREAFFCLTQPFELHLRQVIDKKLVKAEIAVCLRQNLFGNGSNIVDFWQLNNPINTFSE